MLADTTLLLRLYWTIDRRADGRSRRTSKLAMILGRLFLVIVSAALGIFAANLTKEASILHIQAAIIPGLLFTVVMFGVVFIGFSQALQALYLSDDLDKLLVAPIHSQAVMTAKLLSRMPTTVGLLLLGTIPALIAFGIGVGLGPLYYITGLLLILVTPLFGISFGALVAIFMVRLLPARRLNEWVGAASIVIGVMISMLFYLPRLLGGDDSMPDAQTLASIESFINNIGKVPLPTFWVGRTLIEIGRGQIAASAAGSVLTYLLITVGFFLVTIFLANRLYLSGWLRMQSSGSVTQDIGERRGVFGGNSLNVILAYKDWLLRIRDPRLLATLFSNFVLSLLAVFFLLRRGDDGSSLLTLADREAADDGVDLLSAGIVICGVLYFLGWMLFTRLATTSLSIERQAFYILKTAPVSASQLMRSKTFSIFLPYSVVVTIGLAAGIIYSKFSLLWLPYGWLVLLIMGYGLFGYLVSLGFLYPNFDWEDPRRMATRKAGLPSLIGSALYSIVGIVVAVGTYILAHEAASLAVPVVIMGLSLLAGGVWFFVNWRIKRVEAAWPFIGTE